jgi:hypothetical protein
MSHYISHLVKRAGHLNERAQLLREQAQILAWEARGCEREARELWVLALIETLRRWFMRT